MLLRRKLLLSAAAVTGASVCGPARAVTQKVRNLRFAYLLSGESQLGAGATAMAEEVAHRTGGRIKIRQFPDASLGAEVEMLKGVQLGAIDLAFIDGAPLPSVLPEAGIFDIPFLFDSLAHAHGVLDGPIGESYLQRLSGKNLVAFAWGENGLRHLTNAKRPIACPDDLKGLKLRLPQSPVMLIGFRAMGVEASPLPFPQLYAALQAGVFDGEENPIATIRSAKLGQVQQFLTLSGHVYDPAVIVMSTDAYGDLSAGDQAIFQEAAKTGARASRTYAAEAEVTGVPALQQEGMQVLTSIDRALFAAAMASAMPEFEMMFGKHRIEEIRSAA